MAGCARRTPWPPESAGGAGNCARTTRRRSRCASAAGGAGGRAGAGRGVRRRCRAARRPGRAGRRQGGGGGVPGGARRGCGRPPRRRRPRSAPRPRRRRSSPTAGSCCSRRASGPPRRGRRPARRRRRTQELLATAGTAVEELHRRLAEVTGALGRLQDRRARRPPAGTGGARGARQGGGKRGELRTEIEEAARVRDAAVAEFQAFAATGLLRVALPTLEIPGRGAAVGGDADGDPGPGRQRRAGLRGRRGRAVGPDPEAGDRGAQAAGGRDGHGTGIRRG